MDCKANIKNLSNNFTSVFQISSETIDQLWLEKQYNYRLDRVYSNCFKDQIVAMLEKLAFYYLIWCHPERTNIDVNLRKLWCTFAAEAAECNQEANQFLEKQKMLVKKFFTQLNLYNNNHEQLKTVRRLFQNAFSKFKVSPPNYFDYVRLEEEKRSKDIQLMETYLYKREFVSEQVSKELDKLAMNYLLSSNPDSIDKYEILRTKRDLIATQLVTEGIDDGGVYNKINQTYFWQLYLANLNNK